MEKTVPACWGTQSGGLAGAVYTRGQNYGSARSLAAPRTGADTLQPSLRYGFRARLTASVQLLEAATSVQRGCCTAWIRLYPV